MIVSLLVGLPLAQADENPLEHALRATFRIGNGTSSGTAFIVAVPSDVNDPAPRTVLITAAHVLEGFGNGDCTVVMRKEADDGLYVSHSVAVPLRRDDQLLWVRHPEQDVAAVPFDLPGDVDCQPFELRQVIDADAVKSGKLRVGQQVYIPCYPAKLSANEAGWPVLRGGTIASYPLAPVSQVPTLMVDYSNFGGDSGAPVVSLSDGEPRVVALAFGMQRQSDKVTLPFEERVMHTPLGISNTLQAQFIRDTIELLK
ncbi:MAG: serine protease [Planctomycetaceae bacterium]|nr:MAG: serine protease [Planctomycetaceae bacterium]